MEDPILAEVALELIPGENRSIGAEEMVRRWRELMPPVPGVKEVSFPGYFQLENLLMSSPRANTWMIC